MVNIANSTESDSIYFGYYMRICLRILNRLFLFDIEYLDRWEGSQKHNSYLI